MKNYDPNIVWGTHTVEVTLQQWGYTGHLKFKHGGNCKGRDVLGFDFLDQTGEGIESDCNFQCHEEYDYFSAILKDENGNTLEVDGEAEEFNQMMVAIEIIDFKEDKS